MLLSGQLNKQLSSAGSDFMARMLKTTSKDNEINSIKRIIKHFKSTIQKNTESVRRHRTSSAGNKDHYFPSSQIHPRHLHCENQYWLRVSFQKVPAIPPKLLELHTPHILVSL